MLNNFITNVYQFVLPGCTLLSKVLQNFIIKAKLFTKLLALLFKLLLIFGKQKIDFIAHLQRKV